MGVLDQQRKQQRLDAANKRRFREDREYGAPWLARMVNDNGNCDLYRSAQDGRLYADLRDKSGVLITSFDFRNFLSKLHGDELEDAQAHRGGVDNFNAPTQALLTQTIMLLQAEKHPIVDVKTRIAAVDDSWTDEEGKHPHDVIALDLNINDETLGPRVVIIDKDGWREDDGVLLDHPIRFKRPKSMDAMVMPVHGGSINELRELLNIPDEDAWLLYNAFLVECFNPYEKSHPILVLNGISGSGKSTVARFTKELVDPSTLELRGVPKDTRDLWIAAANNSLVVYDNVSSIPRWLSDAFCELATGGGQSTRTPFTENDETIFTGLRPALLTGIEDFATFSDFLSRSIILKLPYIPDHKRMPELLMDERWKERKPYILGALLDQVSNALRDHNVALRTKGYPRMADFAAWASAALDGGTPGPFLEAFRGNVESASAIALEASIVATAVIKLMGTRTEWSGTAGDLLTELEPLATPSQKQTKAWPKNASLMGSKLRFVQSDLMRAGIDVDEMRSATTRSIVLRKVTNE